MKKQESLFEGAKRILRREKPSRKQLEDVLLSDFVNKVKLSSSSETSELTASISTLIYRLESRYLGSSVTGQRFPTMCFPTPPSHQAGGLGGGGDRKQEQ